MNWLFSFFVDGLIFAFARRHPRLFWAILAATAIWFAVAWWLSMR